MSPRHDTTRTLPPSATVRQDHVGTGRERVDMAGDLDIASRGLLEAAVTTCLHRHPREVAVDLHDVAFMDGAGAAGLVACWSRAVAQETRLVVVDPSPAATRILVPGLTPLLGRRRHTAGPCRGAERQRRLECIPCGRTTPHVLGERTVAAGGEVLVQWWRCTECEEGHTIG